LILLILLSSSILKKSIKSTVVNDPQAALTQSLNGLAGNVDKELNQDLLKALHFAAKDSLKKALSGPVTSVTPFKNLSEAELGENPAVLFVLADKKGNILYDNLGIPKPTPSPSPTGTVKKVKTHSKPKGPLLASAKDWPGMDVALAGSRQGGLLTLQDSTFFSFLVPVESKDKILGVVAIGSKIDGPLMESFKNTAVNDVALYSQSQTWCTGTGPAPSINYPLFLKATGPAQASSVAWGPAIFLTQGLPLLGLDQKPCAYLAVFQPVKQIQTVQGIPQKSVLRAGISLVLLTLVLVVLGIRYYLASFSRLFQSISDISQGNLNVSIPHDPWTEWGQLGGALQQMLESLKEKERVSLVLGKVVDPQAARKILAEKDYFSLKGEKRECTLLRADLK
ncbi:MAG TPA: hypothetical protein VK859_09190, partial [bacterium]|nr:hypothetical protein [bacterium]